MNRHDQIQMMARDIATNVHADPDARDKMADGLIKLIGLMLGAQGKYLAVWGESRMNDAYDWLKEDGLDEADRKEAQSDLDEASTMYTIGVRMQADIDDIVESCTNPKVDIERYHQVTGGEWCVCGHHPNSHHANAVCTGVQANGARCVGGPCTEFRVKLPKPAWTHVDRRPETLKRLADPGTLVLPTFQHIGGNAEDCLACQNTNPPYPFICPGRGE